MAAAFTLTDVSLHYSEKQLLSHISITISEGDKIGVVGRNGAGKSTLLRLLAGTEEPDAGDIARKRGLTLAYLPQTPHLRPEDSITQAALSFLPTANEAERESAAYEAQTILSRLGFTDFDQRVGTLSGGQQMRVALAGALCRKADVLLLDEPTNHIDLDMAAWLEDYLVAYHGTLICVTHDRYLLERVFNRIFQVGGGQVQTYQTDYAGYLEERAQREEMAAATLRKQKSLYRTELAWIQRGARARSTKAKGRIDRFETLKENVREAPPEAQLQMKSVASRLGKKILSCEHLHCELGGRTLVRDFSYTLLRDDRATARAKPRCCACSAASCLRTAAPSKWAKPCVWACLPSIARRLIPTHASSTRCAMWPCAFIHPTASFPPRRWPKPFCFPPACSIKRYPPCRAASSAGYICCAC